MPLRTDYASSGDPQTAAEMDATNAQVNTNTDDIATFKLNPVSRTTGYTAAVSDFPVCDASGGAFTVTLPTAPADKSRISAIKMDSSANAVTLEVGGSDRFQVTGGATTLALSAQFVSVHLQYNASSGIWYVLNGKPVYLGNVDNTSDATKWAATKTLTNTEIESRVLSHASSATPSVNIDLYDEVELLTLATDITSMSSGLSGTPFNGQKIMWKFKSTVSQTIAWGASFESSGVATLLAATQANKVHHVLTKYDSSVSKHVCLAVDDVGY